MPRDHATSHGRLVLEPYAETLLPTRYGPFRCLVFRHEGHEHVALVAGSAADDTLCRVHSECFTGEVLGSTKCDCAPQLAEALEKIGNSGSGVLIYLRQEGRGIGLGNKIRAYALQQQGLDTFDANLRLGLPSEDRSYEVAAAILNFLGIGRIQLLTNNPAKVTALKRLGLKVSRTPHQVPIFDDAAGYMQTKRERMGHLLGEAVREDVCPGSGPLAA